jgi:large subunit ribosomal protein L1
VTLPAGTGKEIRVAIFTSDDFKHIAEKTKADMIIDITRISELTADNIDFDELVATKDVIKQLKPYGRTIGPLGLMPNIKSGTLVDPDDLEDTINNLKAGQIEIRADSNSLIVANLGKRKFTQDELYTNFKAVIKAIEGMKPEKIKSKYYKWCKMNRTQGTAISVDVEPMVQQLEQTA